MSSENFLVVCSKQDCVIFNIKGTIGADKNPLIPDRIHGVFDVCMYDMKSVDRSVSSVWLNACTVTKIYIRALNRKETLKCNIIHMSSVFILDLMEGYS